MAIDFSDDAPVVAAAATNGAANSDKPKAKCWLNFGRDMRFTNPDTGEVETVYVTTPIGMPLDTMQPMKGNSKLARRKNKFLSDLQKLCMSLEPGESKEIVGNFKLTMTRAGEALPLSDEDGDEELGIGFAA